MLKQFEHVIESVTLIPSDGGKFEVSANESLIFSKQETHRHANPGEIVNLISKIVNQ